MHTLNEVLEKVAKVLEKVLGAMVCFGAWPGQIKQVLEEVPKKVPESRGAKPSQVQQGSREGSQEGS